MSLTQFLGHFKITVFAVFRNSNSQRHQCRQQWRRYWHLWSELIIFSSAFRLPTLSIACFVHAFLVPFRTWLLSSQFNLVISRWYMRYLLYKYTVYLFEWAGNIQSATSRCYKSQVFLQLATLSAHIPDNLWITKPKLWLITFLH